MIDLHTLATALTDLGWEVQWGLAEEGFDPDELEARRDTFSAPGGPRSLYQTALNVTTLGQVRLRQHWRGEVGAVDVTEEVYRALDLIRGAALVNPEEDGL